ncbi:MAG: hypothetical protein F2667_10030, partial [Actinobacteria bacterium]|nr:hypothetical protein [Actinomycetota bacterium]
MSRLAPWLRGDRAIAVLVGLHLVLLGLLVTQVRGGPLIGDETAYVDAGKALSNLVRDLVALGPVDTREMRLSVVASGWFMPGMGALLAPLFVVVPDASVLTIRIYLALVSTGVLLWAALAVRRALGQRFAVAVLVLPGLVPMWALYSSAAWGDTLAGVVLVVLVAELVACLRRVLDGVAPSLREGARLGLLAIATVYLRSSTSLVVVGLLVVLALTVALSLRQRVRRRGLGAVALAAACFVAVLLPWSIAASQTLGGRVLTTTSVPTVLANTFGDYREGCFGECDPGSTIWFSPLRYAREVGRATGLSEMEVAQQMSAYALRDVTARSYAGDVVDNTYRYTSGPARFSRYLRAPGETGGVGHLLVVGVTETMLYPLWVVGGLLLLLVRRRGRDEQVLSLVLKLGLLALLSQVFVHQAGPRYWPTAAPLLGLATVLLLDTVRVPARLDGLRSLTVLQGVVT